MFIIQKYTNNNKISFSYYTYYFPQTTQNYNPVAHHTFMWLSIHQSFLIYFYLLNPKYLGIFFLIVVTFIFINNFHKQIVH